MTMGNDKVGRQMSDVGRTVGQTELALGEMEQVLDAGSSLDAGRETEDAVGGRLRATGLPEGWVLSTLSILADRLHQGINTSADKVKYVEVGMKILQAKHITSGVVSYEGAKELGDEDIEKYKERYKPLKNHILFTNIGTIGRSIVVNQDADYLIAWNIFLISASTYINPIILKHYLDFLRLSGFYETLYRGGATQFINKKQLEALEIPLPPLAEQTVIAQTLDSLLAQVDNIKTRLDVIPKILKTFRQSVLAAAVSGKLTEAWRGENECDRKSWEEKELKEICISISDGDHQAPPKAPEGIPFLVISSVSGGTIDFSNVSRWVPKEYYDNLKGIRKPEKRDLLYTVTGSFGIPVIVDTDQDFCFQRHIAILKPNHELVNYQFLKLLLSSPMAFKLADSVATGTAQKTVSLTNLRKFKFSYPTSLEQTEIVRRVEELFAFADQIEQQVKNAQGRVNNLTQSILAKAFRGELTAQWREDNPDLISGDNSAEALLAKIQEEREKLKPKKATKKKSTAKKVTRKKVS